MSEMSTNNSSRAEKVETGPASGRSVGQSPPSMPMENAASKSCLE